MIIDKNDKPLYQAPAIAKLDECKNMTGGEPDCDPTGSNATNGCVDGGVADINGCKTGSTPTEFSGPVVCNPGSVADINPNG